VRQSEVLALAIQGFSAQQIAHKLVLSRRTVEKHFEGIYATLRVNTRAQAIAAVTATRTRENEAES
jgi:DNA-binding NarL/FixJ family response regulator